MGWGRVPHTGYRKSSPGPTPFEAVVRFQKTADVLRQVEPEVMASNRRLLVNSKPLAKLTTQVCEGMRWVTIFGTPV